MGRDREMGRCSKFAAETAPAGRLCNRDFSSGQRRIRYSNFEKQLHRCSRYRI